MPDETLVFFKPNIIINDEVDTALAFFKKIGTVKRIMTVRKTMGFFERLYANMQIPNKRHHSAFCSSAEVVAVILTGADIVNKAKKITGDQDASIAAVETVRGFFYKKYPHSNGSRNFVHVSDSVESAEREIKMFFGE